MNFLQLYFDSSLSNNNDKNNPRFVLRNPIYADKFKVSKISIPFSYYTINSTNNHLYIQEDLADEIIEIPVGNYSISTIAGVLQTALNNSTLNNTYTVSYSTTTYKLTITADGNFVVDNVYSTCQRWIGLTETSSSGNSFTFQNALDLSGCESILLVSNDLRTPNSTYIGNESMNVISKIPVNVSPGEILYYEDTRDYAFFNCRQDLNEVSFELFNGDTLERLDLNGEAFSLHLDILF